MRSRGAYYNEKDGYAAEWLRSLISAGHIAPGEVDDRSIVDVRPDDLRGFTQCHFFAGIGIWSHALRLAGWPDNRPIWTGSCPCQPFSQAGEGNGFTDDRHLWPIWGRLIRECRPGTVIGEQVASPLALDWLDHVHADMEAADYAFAAIDLCAAGIGAPHWRQRLWWVAHADSNRRGEAGQHLAASWDDGAFGNHVAGAGRPGPVNGFWADADWIRCTDGKWRPTQSRIFPLAHGYPCRVGKLRAYGNAICAPLAAEFIKTVIECIPNG